MTTTVAAVYEGGVLRLPAPLDLPDGTPVHVTVTPATPAPPPPDAADVLARILAIAAKAKVTGQVETTARDHDQILYGGPEGVR